MMSASALAAIEIMVEVEFVLTIHGNTTPRLREKHILVACNHKVETQSFCGCILSAF